MENLNKNLAENLNKIRVERHLSLDKVAQLTEISKSMLGQIEREETNPSISTVWKIANGLKIPLTRLIETTLPEKRLIKKEDIPPLFEDEKKVCSYLFFRNNQATNFEMMRVYLEPKGKLISTAHLTGTKEYIIVFKGKLTITIDGELFTISDGEAFQFNADKNHIYENKGEETVDLAMLVYYA